MDEGNGKIIYVIGLYGIGSLFFEELTQWDFVTLNKTH